MKGLVIGDLSRISDIGFPAPSHCARLGSVEESYEEIFTVTSRFEIGPARNNPEMRRVVVGDVADQIQPIVPAFVALDRRRGKSSLLMQMSDNRSSDPLVRELASYRDILRRERSVDPFTLPFPGHPGLMPSHLADRHPGLDAAFGATVSMSLQSEYSSRAHQMAAALDLCQSPIEARFLLALVCASAMNDLTISIHAEDETIVFSTDAGERDIVLHILPQAEIAGYFVDFSLELQFTDPFHTMAAMLGTPRPTDRPEIVVVKFAVECDGHEFHEKTAEQAKRDKSRDRDLLAAGYPVVRFTGSEIFQTPLKCAEQIIQDILRIKKIT